jgi:hypothetical protein
MSTKRDAIQETIKTYCRRENRDLTFIKYYREGQPSGTGVAGCWRREIEDFWPDKGNEPAIRTVQLAFNALYDAGWKPGRADDTPRETGGASDGSTPSTPWTPGSIKEIIDQREELSGIEEVPSSRTSTKTAFINWESVQYDFTFPNTETFDIPFEEISAAVQWYVYEGNGWNQSKVCRELKNQYNRDIQRGTLGDVFRALGISKDKPPFAPHEYRLKETEELADKWRVQDEAAVEREYRTGELEHYKDKYEEAKEDLLEVQDWMYSMIDEAEVQPVDVETGSTYRTFESDDSRCRLRTLGAMVSDLHFGKEVQAADGNIYDSDVAWGRVGSYIERMMAEFQAINRPYDRVVVFLLGDMIDGPLGNMHDQQWRGQDVHGFQQLDGASDLVAQIVASFENYFDVPVEVEALPGNHARSTSDYKKDIRRLPGLATYGLAREKSPDDVDWTIHEVERCARREIMGTEVVMAHGDDLPRDPHEMSRVSTADQLAVLSGHGHEVQWNGKLEDRAMCLQNGCFVGTTDLDADKITRCIRPAQRFVEFDPDLGPVPGPVVYCD